MGYERPGHRLAAGLDGRAQVIDYQLIRSRRKTLSIEITREAKVLVRAPMRLSQREIDRFVETKRGWILSHLERQQQRLSAHPEPDEAMWKQWRIQAEQYIPHAAEHYSRLMGVSPTAIRYSRAKTRFGSCSAKNAVTFSLRLMDYPLQAVDYVVVHELAHIRHKNHSRAFYDFVAQVMPDYKSRQLLLKK